MSTHTKEELFEQLTKSLQEKQRLTNEINALRQEDVRRIKHLNRLGTWAQQDPTGPLIANRVQEWVLNELKAALGSNYDKTRWQPECFKKEASRPEICQRCDGPNLTWFTKNALWNIVRDRCEFSILCPQCFAVLAAENGIECTAWELVPENCELNPQKYLKGGAEAPATLKTNDY